MQFKHIVFFLFFLQLAAAATIYGFVYNFTLEPASGFAVSVNSTPTQTVILNQTGFYSFQLSPDYYLLSVYQPGVPNSSTIQNLTIINNGSFEVDLLAFNFPSPNVSIEELNNLSNLNSSLQNVNQALFIQRVNGSAQRPPPQLFPFDFIIILIPAIFIILIIVLFVLLRRRHENPKNNSLVVLTGDEKTIFDKIKEFEGRISQKDLRKNLSLSEAAVSIALTNLEEKGLIVKIKKGRGNIIKVKK